MEIRRISSQVVSIYLDPEDMEELDISYDALDILCPHTRRVLRQLLECALAQTGFDPDKGERLLIEAYPLEEGACLLLFTLRPEEEPTIEKQRLLLFSDLAAAAALCRQLEELPSALYWREGQYILAIVGEVVLPDEVFIAEDGELLLAELEEQHCVLIPQDAIRKLRENFS